ncbi:hypothetical protein SAMN04515679_3922 [Pelosinus fermentans]|uniref:Uncharacterized protein n=1 Tax=Pelosinus fermentans B4 TaxID=1149862 RepID=I9L863_9FIRM|nr:hypothetical protein [Pelosinus fermentans]EIW16451.1 hypothetical protein FB4_0962 [Pelosinus fermentans B4]EIW22568.1 hypothetical protein FA11_0151 [Pelosinus fermentans A11]OAM95758.1 hypothetical protein FR7_03779 [Pelosinus fermentans DSM 17108]SDR32467.1 hypothetical protein SAMN04515679_3922 [Pelosinus fermentans]
MKTCYGGYCYEHKEDREFNSVLSSPMKPFLISLATVLALTVASSFLHL